MIAFEKKTEDKQLYLLQGDWGIKKKANGAQTHTKVSIKYLKYFT